MAAAAGSGAVVFLGGLALCVLLGGEVAAVLVGFANLDAGISVALITAGLLLAPWTGTAGVALLHRGLRRRGGLDGPPVLGTAAAKIEEVREIQEGEEVLLQLDLTIAPDDRPAYRANAGVDVRLSQVGDYRAGRILVVDYEMGRPWRIVVRKDPDAEWAARLATSRIDTAPAATRRTAPHRERVATTRYFLAATGSGLLVSLWPLWILLGHHG
ncbi:hypothetical protein Kpho02_74120 [Kitasatospora phosalacinea]|uniref:Uncharacterized protein n=1 Tax=Kitasatospora phosalacinea TaxID=2065 RepID=A0A9W6QEU7_9ACTN|nr:hypothetical protein [Kitasatospora phosalacinea]GLW75115.1 hypothetical protein Kpho02_74120 [Kitasatospora phosalacinea]